MHFHQLYDAFQGVLRKLHGVSANHVSSMGESNKKKFNNKIRTVDYIPMLDQPRFRPVD